MIILITIATLTAILFCALWRKTVQERNAHERLAKAWRRKYIRLARAGDPLMEDESVPVSRVTVEDRLIHDSN